MFVRMNILTVRHLFKLQVANQEQEEHLEVWEEEEWWAHLQEEDAECRQALELEEEVEFQLWVGLKFHQWNQLMFHPRTQI